MPKVSYDRRGAAAVLTITRPQRRNAVDEETAGLLLAGFRRFEDDPEARVLVVTGSGTEAFCAGADLKAVAERGYSFEGDDPMAAVDEWLDALPAGPMGFTRLTASKPTIAAISGWCLAGGLEVALWCDLRIGTASSRMGYPERRWGVPLIDGGTQRLPPVVGMGRALELILTGRIIEASEAHSWGLLNEVVGDGLHLARALEIAEGLASFPQTTMLSDRRAAIEGAGLPLDEALALEARLGRESVTTGVQGAARFAEGEGRGGEGTGV
ncbi:MAG: crotonase/enoyl-CoA hydratase family protein [bacterium]